MARLLLADGSSQIHRTYHALARQGTNLTAPDGTPTGALLSFLNVLRKAVRQHAPTHLAVTFDLSGPTFRHERYAEYKAQRDKTPEELVAQIVLARQALAALRIPLLEHQGFEADDVLATLTVRAVEAGMDVVILSSDKDLLQLVGPRVVMHHALRDEIMDVAKATEYFGAPPERVPDILAIMGDTSDNVPGVKGIGEKGAHQLVGKYGDIETILASTEAIAADESLGRLKKRMAQLLTEHAADARLARELVTLRRDVPVTMTVEELVLRAPDEATTRELFTRLGFGKLLSDLSFEAAPAAKDETPSTVPVAEMRRIESAADAAAIAKEARAHRRIAVVAVSGADGLSGLAFAVDAGHAAFAPLGSAALAEGSPLREILADETVAKVGHDVKAAAHAARRAGLRIAGLAFDSMIASYVLDPTRRSHDLAALAGEFLGWKAEGAAPEAVEDAPAQGSLVFGAGDESWRDTARDADLALRLADALRTRVDGAGLALVLDDIDMPLVPVLAEMEESGVRIDSAELEGLRGEFQTRLDWLTSECYKHASREFNIASPRQLGDVLYDELGLASTSKTSTGARSTAQDVLEELAGEHPIIDCVLEHRELSKLIGTYLDVLPRLADPATGRVHTTYHQTIAATGRLSSKDPNLQNIPIRSELGRRIRKAFVAGPGNVLVGADYSQVELRIMAHLSGDEALCAAFAHREDIHRATAAKMFHLPMEQVTSEMRNRAKVINFGLLYGMTAHGVSTRLGCSRAEAKELIDGYFGAYPRMRETVERLTEETRNDPRHEARTIFGRVRPLPEIVSRNHGRRSFAERAAVNTVVQGTAADLMKLGMLAVHRDLRQKHPKARLLLQVHDELVAEVPEAEGDDALAVMVAAMEGVHELRAPLEAVGAVASSWYDLK